MYRGPLNITVSKTDEGSFPPFMDTSTILGVWNADLMRIVPIIYSGTNITISDYIPALR